MAEFWENSFRGKLKNFWVKRVKFTGRLWGMGVILQKKIHP